ncbi:uncharacterized protein LOC115797007 [Archocentrus centrarchus]|uniref:uncharacterized protein LOC115797007 n=1 Tax=Archocentrus centrarchus TaxID=63155 RepID=UPI0011EA1FDE|nr:uncharacterized protein LOC115797007 [Archocentrus centrarchus]
MRSEPASLRLRGSFVVNVTQTSYQAEENHNITLEWTFTTKPDRSIIIIHDKLSVLCHEEEKMICRILLLLILTSCVSGSFVVNVTQTSYQAEENHNITLEWTFTTNPDRSIKSLNILCDLITNSKQFVLYHVHEGVEVSESQDAKFSGRVQSDKDALREGRIRLQVSRLRTDDSGLYLCEVNTDDGFSVGRCQLNVTGKLIQ